MEVLFMPTQAEVESFSTEEFEKKVQENGREWLLEALRGIDGIIISIRMLNRAYMGGGLHRWDTIRRENSKERATETHYHYGELPFVYQTVVYYSEKYSFDKGVPYFAFLYKYASPRIKTLKYWDYLDEAQYVQILDKETDNGEVAIAIDNYLREPDRSVENEINTLYCREIIEFILDDDVLPDRYKEIVRTMLDNPEMNMSDVNKLLGHKNRYVSNMMLTVIPKKVKEKYTLEDFGYYK